MKSPSSKFQSFGSAQDKSPTSNFQSFDSAQDKLSISDYQLPQTLDDGLVLRTATNADTELLAQFNAAWLGQDPIDAQMIAAWTRDFISEKHPTCRAENVFIVENAREKKIISSMCLIPQTWTYAGIPFECGRPEAVATHPDYRNRGLVRKQFEALHAKSAAMGHLAQGITGITYFYRQFGYEYALDLGGGKVVFFDQIDALKKEESAYALCAATRDDIPALARWYARDCARSLVACPRTDALWKHLLTGYSRDSPAFSYYIIETRAARAIGYLAIGRELGEALLRIEEYVVNENENVRAVTRALLPRLKEIAQVEAAKQNKLVNAIIFNGGRAHPVFEAIPDLLSKTNPPYAWYLRVPDVIAFLKHIAPALEARLARSVVAGYTGELKITFFRAGMRLAFENGKIAAIENWNDIPPRADGRFPPLVFLQLLFCYRSLDELRAAFPDCRANDDATVLLNALFPKQNSFVIPIG